MKWLVFFLWVFSYQAFSQETTETRELIGNLGGRAALINLYVTSLPDGSARLTGEYLVLPTLQRRFLEGERSKQLGVTFLKEGPSPILYGRPPEATLQGTYAGGVFKGTRYGAAGQERERFEFSESFASMDGYAANVHCETTDARYASTLAYAVESGRLKSIEWRSTVSPGDHPCAISGLEQQAFSGGLRFAAGHCSVTLRDLGEYVRVSAQDCAAMCDAQGYLEPVLVDHRGGCQLLRPQSK
ncbi:MAG TPA: hypothetical protein VIF38_06705 [Burkholderiales bacterium]|jgi:hypothetical protein